MKVDSRRGPFLSIQIIKTICKTIFSKPLSATRPLQNFCKGLDESTHLISSHHITSHLTSSHLTSSPLTHLTHLTSPHLITNLQFIKTMISHFNEWQAIAIAIAIAIAAHQMLDHCFDGSFFAPN